MLVEKPDAEHWLALAKEARETALRMTDSISKRSLTVIAERYELLAQRAQEIKPDR